MNLTKYLNFCEIFFIMVLGYTTITVKKSTKERLRKFGGYGDTWDKIINRILDELEELKPEVSISR